MSTVVFVPQRRQIANISSTNPIVVTTTEPHGYLPGIYVRIILDGNFGMQALNEQIFLATILSPTTFSIDVNGTVLDPFSLGTNLQVPQVNPVAEVNQTLVNAVHNGGPI